MPLHLRYFGIRGSDTRKREGIRLLLESIQREAIHDSGARGALGCYPGTREEYIRSITSWGSGEWESSEKRAFLMTGPAGVGKSAIAQTCAHRMEAAGKLGASFFFRPSGWNDPRTFIPTIVYQLTTRYPAYRDCIDAVILDDPPVLDMTMDIQFRELLIKPLLKSTPNVESDLVIIIDGLDECATVDAQVQIIELITTSIHERTTPFLWAFFSRPEPPITSAFSSGIATSTSWQLPLTLSGDAKRDIEAYLRGSFQVIRAKYNITANVAWPTGEDIHRLVSQSAGLFLYAVAAIRYIDGLGSRTPGAEGRLHTVLQLDSESTENPFSALDQFYMLLMMQIPEGVLLDTLALLHLDQSAPTQIYHEFPPLRRYQCAIRPKVLSYCLALGLSSVAFRGAIANLHSVLEVTKSRSGVPENFQFYHKSFISFLLDPIRSKQYSIESPAVRQHCFEMIVRTMATVDTDTTNKYMIDKFTLQAFFTMVEEHDGKLGERILQQISQVNWTCWHRLNPYTYQIDFTTFIEKIPKPWRPKIVRPCSKAQLDTVSPSFSNTKSGIMTNGAKVYLLGDGDKRCLVTQFDNRECTIRSFFEYVPRS